MLRITDVLRFPELQGVRALSSVGLDRQIRWVHMWPEVLPWLHGGELLLTTAYSWPPDPPEQRRIVRELDRAGVAGILFRAGGQFFAATPPAVVEEAASAGLAVLEATEDVSFVDLAEAINRAIIRTHFESLERSERIHREITEAALEAQAVSDIQTRLADLLGREVLVLDPRGHLLAGDEALARRLLRSVPRPEPVTPDGIAVLEDGTALLRRPVRTGVGAVAELVLVAAPGSPFRDVDVRAVEHAVLVMGLHFLRQQAVADAESRVRSTFVEALLQGRLATDPALRERAQLLGFRLDGTYAVALAVSVGPDGRASARPLHSTEDFQARHRLGQAVEQALRSLHLPVFLAFELNQVVILIPADVPAGRLREQVRLLYGLVHARAPELTPAVAVGRPQSDYSQLAVSLAEARAALSVARGEGVWWYEEALVPRILHGCQDRDALEALHHSTLGRLRAASPALEATAKALVTSGFNQRAAARALHLHWNTLRHRVARMEQLLGTSVDDPDLRLRLQLATLWESLKAPSS